MGQALARRSPQLRGSQLDHKHRSDADGADQMVTADRSRELALAQNALGQRSTGVTEHLEIEHQIETQHREQKPSA